MRRLGLRGLAAFILAAEAIAHAWLALFLTLLVVAVIVVFFLWYHPYGYCRACKGSRGQNPGSDDQQTGRCWRCHGHPERPRFGAAAVASVFGKRWW